MKTIAAMFMSVILGCVLAACPNTTDPPPVEPDVTVVYEDAAVIIYDASEEDAALSGVVDAANNLCMRACLNLAVLKCPEALTIDGGKDCYNLCKDAEATGKFNMNTACVAAATDVAHLKLCKTVRCKK